MSAYYKPESAKVLKLSYVSDPMELMIRGKG